MFICRIRFDENLCPDQICVTLNTVNPHLFKKQQNLSSLIGANNFIALLKLINVLRVCYQNVGFKFNIVTVKSMRKDMK